MTFSDAWIDAGEDEDFADFLARSPKLSVLPPTGEAVLDESLERMGVNRCRLNDFDVVRVPVTQQQLPRFMTEIFGAPVTTRSKRSLYALQQV